VSFHHNIGSTFSAMCRRDELLRFNDHLLNYEGEAALPDLARLAFRRTTCSAKRSAR